MSESQYEMIIYWDKTDNVYVVDVPELSGCMAHGKSKKEALENKDNQELQFSEDEIDKIVAFLKTLTGDQPSILFPIYHPQMKIRRNPIGIGRTKVLRLLLQLHNSSWEQKTTPIQGKIANQEYRQQDVLSAQKSEETKFLESLLQHARSS